MPPIDTITPAMMLTVAGITVITSILVAVVLTAWKPAPDVRDRFGPLLALAIGVILAVGYALAQSADIGAAVLVGIIGGWSSSGLYDTLNGFAPSSSPDL